MFGCTDVVVRMGHACLLDGVSLAVPAGEVTAVVGGDGAGKTTLMRALVGQVPLESGSVSAPGPADIGYMPASSGSWRALSVQENVDFVGGSYGVRGQALADRAAELLGGAGLDQFRDRLAGQLSGGMRRKLAFVLAMLHQPPLLVLDEPSTGVDPVSRVDLWRMTSQAAAAGTAVVMTTTYLDEAERASSILVLDRGRPLLAGTAAQVMASLPGQLVATARPKNPQRAWRRGRVFHEWWPDGGAPDRARIIAADLEDVVIASTLRSLDGSRP
jgi:ABC-2 type transport system ATP-binding protein